LKRPMAAPKYRTIIKRTADQVSGANLSSNETKRAKLFEKLCKSDLRKEGLKGRKGKDEKKEKS
jgi:hypothetical protein